MSAHEITRQALSQRMTDFVAFAEDRWARLHGSLRSIKGTVSSEASGDVRKKVDVVPLSLLSLPDELLLGICEYATWNLSDDAIQRSGYITADGHLSEAFMDMQYGFLSLSNSCKVSGEAGLHDRPADNQRFHTFIEQTDLERTLFVHQHARFFAGLYESLQRSSKSPSELLTMSNVTKLVFIGHTAGSAHKGFARANGHNYWPRSSTTYLTAKNELKTDTPIFPNLESVSMATGIEAEVSKTFALKYAVSVVLYGSDIRKRRLRFWELRFLEEQLRRLARDNNYATFIDISDAASNA